MSQNLLGDEQQQHISAKATTTATATDLELAEEPIATETKNITTLQQILAQTATTAVTTTCGQHFERDFANHQPTATTTTSGFCSPSANDTLTGVELGFNTMDYNFSDIEPLWVRKQWPDILMRVSFVAPVVLLGIVGNLTIIWSICKFKSFRSKPTNIFILSMAIADLITALVCPLAALFTDIYQFYVMGSALCRLEGSIKITCLLVSAYSLNWLSFIWLRYIVQPCRTRISIRQSWIILAGLWMASVLVASPLFCWRMLRSRQWRDLDEIWCCELIHISKYYWVVITFIIVYLPTFFMTIILVIILIQMEKFEAKLRRSRSNQSNSSLNINMKYRRRIVKVLILYLGISIVCWAPFQFSIIYRHFRKEACLPPGYSDFVFASQLLASVPGALNPFVFGFLSQPFRKIVSAFWMFKFLDKLLIWRAKPNSDNHQMDQVQGGGANNNNNSNRQNQQPQAVLVNNNPTTTRVKSGSTSQKRHTASIDTRAGRSHNHNHHHHNSRHQSTLDHPAKTSTPQQAQSNGIKTGKKHHNHNHHHHHSQCSHQQKIKGCENAAYESTIGDEAEPAQQQASQQMGTTSFIHRNQPRNNLQQHNHQAQRPLSPTSVVSMDSINIEENLDTPTSTINNLHLYQQQQQHQHQQHQMIDNKVT